MVRLSILFIVLFLTIGCSMIHNKKKFTLLNHQENNIKLKTGGYYYSVFDRDSLRTNNKGKGIYMRILLNNNAFQYFRNGYGDDCGKIVQLDCDINKSEQMLMSYQNNEYKGKRNSNFFIWNWGKYSTTNDTIKMQWFYNKFGEYYLIEEIGVIIDSTSFRLINGIDYGSKTSWEMDRTYYFKPFPVDNMYDEVPAFNEIFD
jgi:hypothetical protein